LWIRPCTIYYMCVCVNMYIWLIVHIMYMYNLCMNVRTSLNENCDKWPVCTMSAHFPCMPFQQINSPVFILDIHFTKFLPDILSWQYVPDSFLSAALLPWKSYKIPWKHFIWISEVERVTKGLKKTFSPYTIHKSRAGCWSLFMFWLLQFWFEFKTWEITTFEEIEMENMPIQGKKEI
jgi:hypothetical protein